MKVETFNIEIWQANHKRWTWLVPGRIDEEVAISEVKRLESKYPKGKYRVLRMVSESTVIYP